MNGEVSVVALVRGEEQYIFMFNEANRTETLRMLGRYAANPELSFTWYDAAILSQRIREIMPAASLSSVEKMGNHSACTHSFELPPASQSASAPQSVPGKEASGKSHPPASSSAPRFRLQGDM